ncbi:hypothetical protein [Geobacillus kaustophilus]|uniref:hypothetical protein n=1 Tax=Geobacillus kaustophilus TaxID=1462 RepID=UPI0005CDC18C|nr:hypothetical protein [Geobacillus kaustophilus]
MIEGVDTVHDGETFRKKRYKQLLREEIFLVGLAEVIKSNGDFEGARQVWARVWQTREARKLLRVRMPS